MQPEAGHGGRGVYVVRAPYTFGHSQLALSWKEGEEPPEEDRFAVAASYIARCIAAFRERLDSLVRDPLFLPLVRYTATSGVYVKTLVLRTSASEAAHEYKVHLVPLFESHQHTAYGRFLRLHPHVPNGVGGLVGWAGEVEGRVDSDIETRDKSDRAQALLKGFELRTLADRLRA